MACCTECISDLESPTPATHRLGALGHPMTLLAASLGALGLLLWLVPEKRRARRRYHDPMDRRTVEIPAYESMSDVVYQRKR